MKKNILRSFFQLQVLEDGSSFYTWVHPLNTRLLLRSKDITINPLWNHIESDSPEELKLEQNSVSQTTLTVGSTVESGSESD